MKMEEKPTFSIIGFGKLGQALYRALKESGYTAESVFSKSKYPVPEFKSAKPAKHEDLGKIIFITVPDDILPEKISDLTKSNHDFNSKIVIHCSGVLDSDILTPFRQNGAEMASFHPNQAISKETNSFKGTWFDAEGTPEAIEMLKTICHDLGAEMLPIKKEAKPYLHAAAVMASNYLVVLMKLASKTAAAGGIEPDQAVKALLPLMQSSLNNISEMSLESALTGPIARGDVNTVARHLEILAAHPDLLNAYKLLGLETVALSNADEKKLEALRNLLQ